MELNSQLQIDETLMVKDTGFWGRDTNMAEIIIFPRRRNRSAEEWFSLDSFMYELPSMIFESRSSVAAEKIHAACRELAQADDDRATSILIGLELDCAKQSPVRRKRLI